MEIGDLIYIFLLLLFMILGFFNDSRKKKEQEKRLQESNPDFNTDEQEILTTTPPFLTLDQQRDIELEKGKRLRQLNRDKERFSKEGEVVFRSSMDLITDFSKESSLKGSVYKNDTDTLYDDDPEFSGTFSVEQDSHEIHEIIGDPQLEIHPLVKDILGVNRNRELAKGLIYGEILNRKY